MWLIFKDRNIYRCVNLLEDFFESYVDLFELYGVFNVFSGFVKNEEELLNMKIVTKNVFFIKIDVLIREKVKDKNILNMDGLMGWKVILKNKVVILMAWY